MSKYYEAIKRSAGDHDIVRRPEPDRYRVPAGGTVAIADAASLLPESAEPLFDPDYDAQRMAGIVAKAHEIQRLSERLAPLAVLDSRIRLVICGCRPGDGASTIAVALAMDLSQRLSLRTMLVDAHLRHLSLHRFFARRGRGSAELVISEHLRIRPTGLPRLDFVTWQEAGSEANGRGLLDEFESLAAGYPAVVVDLGVVRLDARMLPLVRPTDPIVLIVRYGHTERQELATAAHALRAANRAIAGVVLNATVDHVAKCLRSLVTP